MTEPVKLLILGGTGEAVALAERAAADPRLEVITSLAGRTRHPAAVPGRLRIGGFGGAAGLAAFLEDQNIDLLVDATHPYAAAISAHAATACEKAHLPRLVLVRPPWEETAGDRWIEVPDATAAADALVDLGRRVFLSTGRQDLAPFARLADHWFLLRLIDPPAEPLPLPHHELILARGPFTEADERALLGRHRIDALVSKNSGGSATYAKISAARGLGLPVVMVARPAAPAGEAAADPETAFAWIDAQLRKSPA